MASSGLDDVNQKLVDIINRSRAKIFVIGAGGAGNNTISRLGEIGIEGAETISINTDAQDLFFSKSNEKILIGEETCGGLGAGGIPDVGEASAEESEEEIKRMIDGADMVFVTCGLGGGTGTGSAPVISRIAQKCGALTIAVVTMPFSAEGLRRRENAEKGLEKLQAAADTVLVIPNDKLLEVAPSLPINKAFMVSDELLGRAVKGITELITKPGLVSLDFADIKSVMKDSGMAMIGMGESDTGDRAIESVHEALNSPLLDLDISNAKSALINITGSNDLTLNEAEKIVQIVADELDPEANIIWGTQIQDDLASTVRTTIVVAGVNSPSILGSSNDGYKEKPRGEEKSTSDTDLEGFIDDVF
ncbi:cell division protein FtsZ [Methanosphaera sp. BMS]|uniref:cell division protein FtsZ n=1 Tax=Methanosphaera sp. BMS TaxID=1789762 RepID=UPI0037431049